MGEQKEEDLYRNFSRKDLQGLCKKYGLPANKSNSEMATSLILFLEKKNLSSRGIWEGISGDPLALGTTVLQAGARMNMADEKRKDCGHMASHSDFGNNQHHNHQVAKVNDMQQYQGFATSDKGSEDVGALTQLHRESNSGAGIQENTFSSVVSSSVVAPSPTFTFDVCCEDGIKLFVDLNSSPSDWVESLKAGVHICDDMDKPKSQSFHEDIGFLSSSKQKNGSVIYQSNETDKGQLKDGSYPTTILTDVQAQTNEADRGDAFLPSPGLKSLTDAGHSSENLKELQAELSSRLESGAVGQLPSVRYCRSDETLVADLDVDAAVQTGTSNLLKNSLPSDPKYSWMPAHHGASAGDVLDNKPTLKCSESSTTVSLEMQASNCATMNNNVESFPSRVGKCVDLAEQSKDTEMVQCGIANSVQSTPSKDEHVWRPVEAVEQTKGLSSSPLLNSSSLDLTDNKGKAKLNECKVANVETLGASNYGSGTEGSECLKFDNFMEKPQKRPADSESNTELKRKRHFNSVEGQNKFVNDEAMILRSSKQFSEDAHSNRRRSSRLFTK